MKKLKFLIMPLMAISLLANCNHTPTTYTVVLSASDGASFANDEQYLFLPNVKKNTVLNEIKGYAIPISPDHLDFNHWTDTYGNFISDNVQVTSDLFLTSDFYHGPEYERNNVKTYIYDDLWDILNNLNWNSPFSSDREKNQILKSFSDMTTNAVMNDKLTTTAAVDAMKEFYLVLKDQLFKARHEELLVLQKVFDDCKNQLNATLEKINESKDPILSETIIHLDISYFEVKNFAESENIHEYAYKLLSNFIKNLPLDDANRRMNVWNHMARGLMLASYYMKTTTDFDTLFNTAQSKMEELVESSGYTLFDITFLSKVYADYYVAFNRSIGLEEKAKRNAELDYILFNYGKETALEKHMVDLYKSFFSAHASEKSHAYVSTYITKFENAFIERINKAYNDGNVDAAFTYCSIGELFAEGIRKNPVGVQDVQAIVSSFFYKITSDVVTDTSYKCYIKPFTSFAKATSLIDFNHERVDGKSISFQQYRDNASWIINQINSCTYREVDKKYEAMNILSDYVAKYSDFGNFAINASDGTFYKAILKPDDYGIDNPMSAAFYLPFDNTVVLKAFRPDEIGYADEEKSKFLIRYLNSTIGDEKITYINNKFRELFVKLNLKTCWSKEYLFDTMNFFNQFENYRAGLIHLAADYLKKEDIIPYLLPLTRLSNNKNLFRGRKDEIDFDRSYDSIFFVYSQMEKIFVGNAPFDLTKYNECIAKVIIDEYIPNITEDIDWFSREELQYEIDTKIDVLLEEYK